MTEDERRAAILGYIAAQIERLERQAAAIDAPLLAHLLQQARLEASGSTTEQQQPDESSD